MKVSANNEPEHKFLSRGSDQIRLIFNDRTRFSFFFTAKTYRLPYFWRLVGLIMAQSSCGGAVTATFKLEPFTH